MPTPDTPTAAIAHHESVAAYYERQIADLERGYGKGVRPSWVSEDISIACGHAKRHRAAAEEWRARADEVSA